MAIYRKSGKLKDIKYYLPRTFKFYNLGNAYITPTVFTIILLVFFLLGVFAEPDAQLNLWIIALYVFSAVVIKLTVSLYLAAWIKELKGEAYTLRSCLADIFKKSYKIIIASFICTAASTLLVAAAILTKLFIIAVPGLILYIMLIFTTCCILDNGMGIKSAIRASTDITYNYKWKIFIIIFVFSIIMFLGMYLMLGFFSTSESILIYTFVQYFLLSIYNLMNEKLIALMYNDLEYGKYNSELDEK